MSSDLPVVDRRVCSCSECSSWAPPPESGRRKSNKYGEQIAWRGNWWHATKAGYYRCTALNTLLHDEIYRVHVGTIPRGHIVHHIDEDRSNNDLDNLELLTRSEHMVIHMVGGRAGFNIHPFKRVVCANCGVEYDGRTNKAKFCSEQCMYVANRRAKGLLLFAEGYDATCITCGNRFHAPVASKRRKYCSEKCAWTMYNRRGRSKERETREAAGLQFVRRRWVPT